MYFSVCSPFTYGEQCLENCTCEKTNSEKCDAVTGTCQCRTGWNGSDCSQDVDECEEGIRTCNTTLHQVCFNDQGSSHCECLYGGNNLTSCIRMYYLESQFSIILYKCPFRIILNKFISLLSVE